LHLHALVFYCVYVLCVLLVLFILIFDVFIVCMKPVIPTTIFCIKLILYMEFVRSFDYLYIHVTVHRNRFLFK